jgi:hypothetical protein
MNIRDIINKNHEQGKISDEEFEELKKEFFD